MSMSKESIETYYHFTDGKGAEGIAKEKKIRPSTDPRDIMIGQGVYFTTYGPSEYSKTQILRNNYDGAGPSTNRDRVKYCIKVELPTSLVEKAHSSRDVYKQKGDAHLDLTKYPHEIMKVD